MHPLDRMIASLLSLYLLLDLLLDLVVSFPLSLSSNFLWWRIESESAEPGGGGDLSIWFDWEFDWEFG